MPIFFTTAQGQGPVGRTVACQDEHTKGTISLLKHRDGGPVIGWDTERSIVTRVSVTHKGNYQFLHTLGNDVYVYVFGDRIGQMTISGLSLARDCSLFQAGSVAEARDAEEHGFEKVLRWYRDNRLANRKAPVEMTIGKSTSIDGFVVGLSGKVVDPTTHIMEYHLSLLVLPEKS